jgi:uroporphyrinogen-III decarboxylase
MTFSPGIYEHAAALIGARPGPVSRDAELLFQAHRAAWETYSHPMVVAGIDVYNIEPEAMGAGIDRPPGDGVTSVISHPCSCIEALSEVGRPDYSRDGRMPMILDVAARLAAVCEGPDVFVPVYGPLALANALAGMDEILCGMMEEPERVREALGHLADIQAGYVEAILEAGARPLIFESGACPPLLPPAIFSDIEAPALGSLFARCRAAGDSAPACIIGGDVVPILPTLASLKPGFLICPSETDQLRFVEVMRDFPEVSVRINMPVTAVTEDDWHQTAAMAELAMELANQLSHASVGTGVVPFNTPPERIFRLRDHIHNSSQP